MPRAGIVRLQPIINCNELHHNYGILPELAGASALYTTCASGVVGEDCAP